MHDRARVGVGQPLCRLTDVAQSVFNFGWAFILNLLVEVDTGDVLDHHVVNVFLVGEVVDSYDIRMTQTRRRPAFAVEPVEVAFVIDTGARKDLDRTALPRERMLCQINRAHSAGAEQRKELVLPEKEAFEFSRQELLVMPLSDQPLGDEKLTQLLDLHRFAGSEFGEL